MTPPRLQGSMANLSGHMFENMMIPIFELNGFKVMYEREFNKIPPENRPSSCVLRNAGYTTIYGHPGRTEFVIKCGARRVRVEAKYMGSAGSVDEKLPYMLLNGIERYPEKEVIFVLDGDGWKTGARQWLKDRIDDNWMDYRDQGKMIRMMTIAEFMDWFNHEEWEQ